MSYLRINRFGTTLTNDTSPNQCKDVGHKQYRYHVTVTCHSKNLDEQGFIVDHLDLHDTMQKDMAKISSCEETVVKCAESIDRLCTNKGVNVIDIYIKLEPVTNKETVAFIEYSLSGKFN